MTIITSQADMAETKPTKIMSIKDVINASSHLKGPIMPSSHLNKLVGIVNVEFDQPMSELLLFMLNDSERFFGMLVEHWSTRTISAAMESLRAILQVEEVKDSLEKELGIEDVARIESFVEAQRKSFMNKAKKQHREQHRQENSKTKQSLPAQSEAINNDSSDEPLVDDAQVGAPQDGTKKDTAKKSVDSALWILNKYIDGETDEFKLLVLEIIQRELTTALHHLSS